MSYSYSGNATNVSEAFSLFKSDYWVVDWNRQVFDHKLNEVIKNSLVNSWENVRLLELMREQLRNINYTQLNMSRTLERLLSASRKKEIVFDATNKLINNLKFIQSLLYQLQNKTNNRNDADIDSNIVNSIESYLGREQNDQYYLQDKLFYFLSNISGNGTDNRTSNTSNNTSNG